MEKKKDNPGADTTDLEKKNNEMVYGLYGLGEEEIEIVKKNYLTENKLAIKINQQYYTPNSRE